MWALPAAAQISPPPPDVELLSARVNAAEAETRYLALIVRRMTAEEQATAKWWADYIGIPEKK
jgi:hypothetical protein